MKTNIMLDGPHMTAKLTKLLSINHPVSLPSTLHDMSKALLVGREASFIVPAPDDISVYFSIENTNHIITVPEHLSD
jgi:hypothetical protein